MSIFVMLEKIDELHPRNRINYSAPNTTLGMQEDWNGKHKMHVNVTSAVPSMTQSLGHHQISGTHKGKQNQGILKQN